MYGRDTAGSRWELSTHTAVSSGGGLVGGGAVAGARSRTQRRQVLQAVLSIASIGGYESLSVSLILRTSGVPRRDFNAWFASPEDAFVAAHEQCMGQLVRVVRSAVDLADDPEQQLRQGLGAAVAYLVADPARADAVVLEVHVAGHRAVRSQESSLDDLVAAVRSVLIRTGIEEPIARRVARFGVGALREAIRTRVARGELHTLPGVVGELAAAAFPLRTLVRSRRGPAPCSTTSLTV